MRSFLFTLLFLLTGVTGVWGQITPTTDTDNPVYYLIQSYQNTGFYMRPNGTKVTTLNSLTDEMKWFFLDAGTGTEGSDNVQYYYICQKNGNNIQYMYFSGPNFISSNNRIWIELQAKSGSDDNYKFYINPNNTSGYGGYNIIPKGTNTSSPSSLNKRGRNAGSDGIQVGAGLNDEASCWNLIALTDYEWTLRSDCFTVSDATNRYFYKIRSQNNASYYIKPGATYVETSNTNDDDMIWYFEEAASDDLMTYYYIRHANTGKYLRYISTGVGQENATELADHTGNETGNDEARFQFAVARGANDNESISDPKGIIFNIIPKLFVNTSANNIRSLSCDGGQGKALKTKQDRYANTTHWTFMSTEYSTVCANPTITFSNVTGKATITTATTRSIIYYTTDGTEPSSSNGTEYTGPFSVTEQTTIKAIVTRTGFTNSEVTTKTIYKVATPSIQDNGSNAVSITCATEGATIYYTTNGSDPTTSSSEYSGPLTENVSGVTIKAIAVKDGMINSAIGTGSVTLQCAKPVFTKNGESVTISCNFPASGVSIYYTKNGGEPSSSSTLYSGAIPVTIGDVIKAIAVASGYEDSPVATKTIRNDLTPTDGKYLINSQSDFETFADMASETEGASKHYVLRCNVEAGSEISQPFTGTFEVEADANGNFYKINNLSHALFNTVNGGTVKNVMLKGVNISSSLESVGAIAGVAEGYSCIYNCGILPNDATFPEGIHPRVSTSGSYAGSIVGSLKDDSRVVNCFSYADVSAASTAAGIVGYNTFASTAAVTNGKYANLRTAVVNCMFYGDITGGSSVYPVYGGSKILNTGNNGINNYNFYREEASLTPTDYNCSWPASEENLTRFEYYRYLLNSNRELCGWWVGAPSAPRELSAADVQAVAKDASLMAKWVLDPSIAPYPILKTPGYYPSAINQVYQPIESSTILSVPMRFDSESKNWVARTRSTNTIETNAAPDIEGQTLGTVSVEIQAGNHHTATAVTRTFTITAMDIDNNDFCYGKIQLPYYNDVFGNPEGATWSEKYGDNYTDMVVTGWDITTSEGTTGTFSDDPITGNNFADRNCTAKDTHRTFAQGGFYYVPYGVTSITITAHWANAYYLSNTGGNYDRVYFYDGSNNKTSAGQPFAPAGTRSYGSNDFGGQTINNGNIKSILEDNNTVKESSVYDCAIVLVGNYQYRNNTEDIAESTRKPFTLMTVDLDFDNEPDYCFEWQFGGGGNGVTRAWINPVRFDFLPIVELGIAMKEDNSKYNFAIGKVTPYGHFETTETALIHMGQFEYADKNRDVIGPVILNNGTFDQICRGSESDADQHVNYFILGGHVKMPSFTPGSHVKLAVKSRHCAVNVLGGEIPYFYLSGNYIATPTNEGSPHCYIDGGKLDFVASGAKEQIVGDVVWKIDHGYIGEFFGGGINADKAVAGNIDITINRSKVWKKFCGGPQFGNMNNGKTVTTRATGTTFEVFYGAGNGGTCYSQYDQSDNTPGTPNSYNWESDGKLANYTALKYRDKATGYHAKYELEMINSSAGTMNNAVCRTYMYAAQFATTNTGTISSTLTDCTVETNFFGGGLLGGVNGSVTSKLTGHTVVKGNAYGAGYGIANLTVDVLPKETGNTYTRPTRNENTSVITPATYPTATTYTWTNNNTFGNTTLSTTSPAILNPNGDGENFLFTEISLDNLGTVTGAVTLTITGSSVIGTTGDTTTGHVFGGGDESAVDGSTTVNISGNTQVLGNVFGGGNEGEVSGNTTVNIRATEPANP